MKKIFLKIIEFIIILAALFAVCFYINSNLVIKSLYMDDLLDWSWFRGLSLYDFAIKFYSSSSRYRPTFETIQYFIYTIVGTDPTRFTVINSIYNVIVAIILYYIVKRINKNSIVSFATSFIFLVSHFAYYQIGQAIGPLETTAMMLSLIILHNSLSLVGAYDIDCKTKVGKSSIILRVLFTYIVFFILVFDHERFLSTASIIFLSILLIKGYGEEHKNESIKTKALLIILFVIIIALICYIRYLAIGKVVPAGTGGTYVEDTFVFSEFIINCLKQVAIIVGINIGPEHLCGISFIDIKDKTILYLTIASIVLLVLIVLNYVILRIKSYKSLASEQRITIDAIDIIFLSFISTCIAASSVTIRVELRFVYTSFVATFIYLTYMIWYIGKYGKRFKLVFLVLFLLMIATRLPVEIVYRSHFDKIYCISDLHRMNSLYDETIGKYGIDAILNDKKIYVVNKYFGLTDFYAEYFFKIYDANNIGNKIILVNDLDEVPSALADEDSIVLFEDFSKNGYTSLK